MREQQAGDRPVRIAAGGVTLDGDLAEPHEPLGTILFAHGSGSSRHSPRNQAVAAGLRSRGFATLLLDLLTVDEEDVDEITRELRFDIGLLAERLVGATDWLRKQPGLSELAIGCFGASTGAGAALVCAAERPRAVAAVVSRGGRPDLAGPALSKVRAPTLLIVGGEDRTVITINRRALAELRCEKELRIVPGATHLFEERGALEQVAEWTGEWFARHLVSRGRAGGR